jgi:cholesterol oxidase
MSRDRASPALELHAFSCQYPPGLLEGPIAYGSMHRLARALREAPPDGVARRVVSLGDLVYVDATAGLLDPHGLSERFDGPWERLAQSPEYRAMRTGARAGFVAMPDDHELDENWAPRPLDPGNAIARARGVDAFRRHLHDAAVGVPGGAGPRIPIAPGWSMFVADTRLGREARTLATVGSARILSREGWLALVDWLRDEHAADPWRPKLMLCPALLLPRRLTSLRDAPASALRSDAWDGFPASLGALLGHVAREGLRNLVVVSGDEHLAMVVRAEVSAAGGPPVAVHSVHCPAMHAPYPFANGRSEAFATDEAFVLDDPQAPGVPVRCTVRATRVPPVREGWARIRVALDRGRWCVRVAFHDGAGFDDAEATAVEAPGFEPLADGPRVRRAARLARERAVHDGAPIELGLDRPD